MSHYDGMVENEKINFQRAEIERLTRENAELRRTSRSKSDCGHPMNYLIGDDHGHFSCVLCKLAAAEADTKRLDWLINTGMIQTCGHLSHREALDIAMGSEKDAVIDAAKTGVRA